MMTEQIVPFEIPRDRWLRPLVIAPSGGKPVPYTRCTTFIGGIEDNYALGLWQQRHVAMGLAMDPELLATVQGFDLNDKSGLDGLCDRAKEAAGAMDAARIGTYLHALTEASDRGEDTSRVPAPKLANPRPVSDFEPDLAAYRAATKHLEFDHIEQFGVLDALRIGGTSDRIVKIDGKRYIADLKTGSISLGALKIAAQLAVYSRCYLYDWRSAATLGDNATIEQAKALRTAPGVDVDRGIVIHLPKGEGICNLYWVDLLAGWDAVRVCRDIRERRSVKYRDLFSPYLASVAPTERPPLDLAAAIASASSEEQLHSLWRENEAAWSDELTSLAKQRIAAL